MKDLVLANEWLEVKVARVGEYRSSRFDWTGIVKQVRLKQGNHTYCVPEKPGREGEGGIGICNEFGIFHAIGYDETPVGDRFPKLGVGLLKKRAGEDYHFAAMYDNKPFDIQVRAGDDCIDYEVQPADCRGYMVMLNKRLSIEKSVLRIDYHLVNVGTRPIRTHEYAHNFLGINGFPIGPDYQLNFSIPLASDSERRGAHTDDLVFQGSQVEWVSVPDKEFYYCMTGLSEATEVSWELIHKPSGAGVRESGNFPVSTIALWGARHVVSPELFIELDLCPGEGRSWTRTYEFFSLKTP